MNAPVELQQIAVPPKIGTAWPEQGGVYIGSRLKDGALRHIIIPGGTEHDIVTSFNDMPEKFEGLTINGFSDWQAPEPRDLMLSYINVPELYHSSGLASIYLTSAPYGSDGAWVVDFEDGGVSTDFRGLEWRVRPVRSIIA